MMYVKVNKNFEIQSDPLNINDLRTQNPNVSFPSQLTVNEAAELGYCLLYEKYPEEMELDYDEVLEEGEYELVDGVFYRNWKISKVSDYEKQKRIDEKWKEIRTKRNQLLSNCDWCLLVDSPLSEKQKKAIIQYRKKLRNITETKKNPFTLEFPDYPL